jgi:hypothetical protein
MSDDMQTAETTKLLRFWLSVDLRNVAQVDAEVCPDGTVVLYGYTDDEDKTYVASFDLPDGIEWVEATGG